MTREKNQLRGKNLEVKIRSVIEQMISIETSRGREYEFVATHVAEEVGCSRTTLMKYNPLVEEILATLEAGKRSKYGNVELTNLRKLVTSLKEELAKKGVEITELRSERFEMYDCLLKEGIDVASVFRDTGSDEVASEL